MVKQEQTREEVKDLSNVSGSEPSIESVISHVAAIPDLSERIEEFTNLLDSEKCDDVASNISFWNEVEKTFDSTIEYGSPAYEAAVEFFDFVDCHLIEPPEEIDFKYESGFVEEVQEKFAYKTFSTLDYDAATKELTQDQKDELYQKAVDAIQPQLEKFFKTGKVETDLSFAAKFPVKYKSDIANCLGFDPDDLDMYKTVTGDFYDFYISSYSFIREAGSFICSEIRNGRANTLYEQTLDALTECKLKDFGLNTTTIKETKEMILTNLGCSDEEIPEIDKAFDEYFAK